MNVLFTVPWDNIGGVCNVVNAVALYLRNRGHGVQLLFPGETDELEQLTSRVGLPAYRLNLRPPFTPGAGIKGVAGFGTHLFHTRSVLRKLFTDLRLDIVNVHFPSPSSIQIPLALRGSGASLVTSIHGADVLPYTKTSSIEHHCVNFVLRRSDALIAPSQSYVTAVARTNSAVRARPVSVISNGVDPDELGADPTAQWTEAEPPYVLSVASLVPYKGVDILIRAFSQIAAEHPELTLELVSNGPERERLAALAAELGISAKVHFRGVVDRKVVARLIRGSTVFVLASRSDSESFGIAAAEALALDRAVIGSRVGALPEMIEDEHTGLLVAPGNVDALANAMRRMLSDRPLRERLGRAGGERIRSRYLWSDTGAAYEALFQRVITASPHAPHSRA